VHYPTVLEEMRAMCVPRRGAARHRLVREVRPGISGWAQVNGAKLVTKGEKEKLDEWYIRNASLWLDLRIIMITIKVVLKGRPLRKFWLIQSLREHV
jgi:lipopolysaccharide/colanic/teichoic acid biosynthesis glycosyltransferase